MKLFTPFRGVPKSLHYLLIAELPFLIITLGLFAWGIDSLRDALRFQQLSGRWKGGPNDKSGYGFEYGTQQITYTSTWTGTSRATNFLQGGSTGTFTYTNTRSMYPYIYGTAFYSDVYESAGVRPEDLPRISSTRTSYLERSSSTGDARSTSLQTSATQSQSLSSRAVPTAAPAAPLVARAPPVEAPVAAGDSLVKRDGSWSDGATFESTHDGLYDLYDDAEGDFSLWIGLLSVMLAVVALRILATIGYLIYNSARGESTGHNVNETSSLKSSRGVLNFILAFANLAVSLLLALGISLWYYFDLYQGLGSSDVQATLAFYVIATVTSFVVMIMASIAVHRVKKAYKQAKRQGAGEKLPSRSNSDGDA
ncbi:unnamed protein product [Sympodiomycopsis kandeliae]